MRSVAVICGLLALLACAGCQNASAPRPSTPAATTIPRTSPSLSSTPAPATTATAAPALHTRAGQRTPQGMAWAVDSTLPINETSLSNVRGFYRGHHLPAAWGRYLSGSFAIHRGEIDFAAAHHIALYLLMPDGNCSGCGGGDACGNDQTRQQAVADADQALDAARRLKLPPGTALFKDVEQVGSCSGELTGRYLDAWFHRVRDSPYRPGFYGNSTGQDYDFPRAYCEAVRHDHDLARDAVLAQDEPEPRIGAPAGSTGPDDAPRFTPKHPRCVSRDDVDIWQYGESLSDDNLTDIDQIRPATPGLLLSDGSVSGGAG